MAKLNQTFDASTVAPQQSMDVLPAADYLMQAVESDVKNTKANDGSTKVEATCVILDGPFKNRKVWVSINNRNKSAEAERIGQGQLSQWCHAVGVIRLDDTAQLHNKPFVGRVKVRPAEGQYSARNEVTDFMPASGYKGAAQQARTTPMVGGAAAPAPWAAQGTPQVYQQPQPHPMVAGGAPWNQPQVAVQQPQNGPPAQPAQPAAPAAPVAPWQQ